jgi:serine/threonine protein phosphatase PrpC
MRNHSVGVTDVGRRRPHNEDYFLCDDEVGLYVVADGVGGHAKGEIASQEAVEQLHMWVRKHLRDADKYISTKTIEGLLTVRRMLESGVQSACYMVFGMAEQDPEKRGMSTTMSALLIRRGQSFVAQVGDSRVYRMRQGVLTQMTEDHTLVNYKLKQGLITAEEAKNATGKNVITRAVGHKDYVQVDTGQDAVVSGDRFFLCTDGFHGYMNDDVDLVSILRVEPIEKAAKAAISYANDRGGRDNITAVIVSIA